jgi:hypothetical protein
MVFPQFMGLGGVDADGTPWTLALVSVGQAEAQPMDQRGLELTHVTQYRADLTALTGRDDYVDAAEQPHSDPPDLVMQTTSGDRVGVDMTSLVDGLRRRLEANANELLSGLYLRMPDCPRLDGWSIQISQPDSDARPPKLLDREIVSELLPALLAMEPRDHQVVLSFPLPDHLSVTPLRLPSGIEVLAYPGSSGQPRGGGSRFDLRYTHPNRVTAVQAADELVRIVTEHDKPSVQELVVTIGGPSRSGLVHPADWMFLDLVKDQPTQHSREEHHPWRYLRKVRVHDWRTGEIVDLPGWQSLGALR